MDGTPEKLDTPGKRVLYNNLSNNEELALTIDEKVKEVRRDGWRGDETKERELKAELFEILKDGDKVDAIFSILKEHGEY